MHILAIVSTEEMEAAGRAQPPRAWLAYAETGAQGVDLAVRGAFDIILLDPCLPDMSGRTVLRRPPDGAAEGPPRTRCPPGRRRGHVRGLGFGPTAARRPGARR